MNNPGFSEDPKSSRFTVLVKGQELKLVMHVTENLTIKEAQKLSTALSKAIVQASLNLFYTGGLT